MGVPAAPVNRRVDIPVGCFYQPPLPPCVDSGMFTLGLPHFGSIEFVISRTGWHSLHTPRLTGPSGVSITIGVGNHSPSASYERLTFPASVLIPKAAKRFGRHP